MTPEELSEEATQLCNIFGKSIVTTKGLTKQP